MNIGPTDSLMQSILWKVAVDNVSPMTKVSNDRKGGWEVNAEVNLLLYVQVSLFLIFRQV